ncbi:hypothetical protein PF008_g23613 [Phytophthora fragariae]|uniref:Uncharacterized protein n=1 Tax=Phytophthora fragariae TaxID=53985 RepID=A0A6G0QQG2_9STRA|nr:hypothetical protein PF008_g23613 [Phytophthora fragariae]
MSHRETFRAVCVEHLRAQKRYMTDQASRDLRRRLLQELPESVSQDEVAAMARSILDQIPAKRITLPVLNTFLNRQVIRPQGAGEGQERSGGPATVMQPEDTAGSATAVVATTSNVQTAASATSPRSPPGTPPPMQRSAPPAPSHRTGNGVSRPRVFPANAEAAYPYPALLGQRIVEGGLEIRVQWEPTWEPADNFSREEVAAMQTEMRNQRCARRL